MARLEEYSSIVKLVVGSILDQKGVTGTDRLKYYNFAKELCKTSNINDLINEHVNKENVDRVILEQIAKKRDSICNALKSGEDIQHKVFRKLRKKYVKP
jgi:hypothetical protein